MKKSVKNELTPKYVLTEKDHWDCICLSAEYGVVNIYIDQLRSSPPLTLDSRYYKSELRKLESKGFLALVYLRKARALKGYNPQRQNTPNGVFIPYPFEWSERISVEKKKQIISVEEKQQFQLWIEEIFNANPIVEVSLDDDLFNF